MAFPRTSTRSGDAGSDTDLVRPPSPAANGRHDTVVEITRKRSDIGRKPKHKGTFRSLGIPRKIGRKATHRLTPEVVGALQAVRPFVATRVVLPSNYKFEISPSDAVQLGKGGAPVSNGYKIDGDEVGGTYLQWESGDTARVEHHAGFVLVAWTSRLSAREALRLLHTRSHKDDVLLVDTLDESLELDPAAPLPEHLVSSSQLVRLLRLETESETLIWEIPFKGQPASRRPAEGGRPAEEHERPLFAVLAEELPEARLRHHLENTATAFVAVDADDVVTAL